MRRNCNLELRLFPSCDDGHSHHQHHPMMEAEPNTESPQQNLQKLTIFYDGKMCIFDVTELQARWILMLASKGMEEKVKTPTGSEPSSPSTLPLYSPSTGLSMKRSLQRFLQKRKNRIQEASPYNH